MYSFRQSGNEHKCPFCNADQGGKTDEENIEELMKRVASNDAGSMNIIGSLYLYGVRGLPQDRAKAIELWKQAVKLDSSDAHYNLGVCFDDVGDLKKAKFHLWQDMKVQDSTLEQWSHCLERWDELSSIGRLLHLLGIILPCITCLLYSIVVSSAENQSTQL